MADDPILAREAELRVDRIKQLERPAALSTHTTQP